VPIVGGAVSVAASAVKICSLGSQGALVQNLGSVVVTLGSSGVTAGNGIALPANMTSPIQVPGGGPAMASLSGSSPPYSAAFSTEDLYGIGASAGPTSVAFMIIE